MISTRTKIEGRRPIIPSTDPSYAMADGRTRSVGPSCAATAATTTIDYQPTSSGTTKTFSFNPSSSSSSSPPPGSFDDDDVFNQESIDLMSSIDGLLGFHEEEKDRAVDQSVGGLIGDDDQMRGMIDDDDQRGGMSDHLEDGEEDIDYDDVLSVSDSSPLPCKGADALKGADLQTHSQH